MIMQNHIEFIMKKLTAFVRYTLICAFLCAGLSLIGYSQDVQKDEFTKFVPFSGRVVNEQGIGIPDVIIQIWGTPVGCVSKEDGYFNIQVPEGQQFGLYCIHEKYIEKNFPIDTALSGEITLVLKEPQRMINFVEKAVYFSATEIDKTLPVPKIKTEERVGYEPIVNCDPAYPGGVTGLFNHYNNDGLKQLKTGRENNRLKGVYHGQLMINEDGWMELLEIDEPVSDNQSEQLRDFFKRFGRWEPATWRGKKYALQCKFVVEF